MERRMVFGLIPLIQQFFLGALAVSGGCRMDYQRFYIGNVSQQGEQFQIVDEIFCFLCIAFDFEGEDGTAAVREVFFAYSACCLGSSDTDG